MHNANLIMVYANIKLNLVNGRARAVVDERMRVGLQHVH